jgi:predicted peptidase
VNSLRTGLFFGLLIVAAGCGGNGSSVAHSTKHFPQQTGFVHRDVKVDGEVKSVWVFVPPNYDPNRVYPAILFLHGLFEGGDGGTNVLSAGLGPIIARNPEGWPFLTIFPQSNGNWKGPEREHLAMAALDDAEKTYSIDPDRVILAGLSYGGLGVWEIGARHKDRFAALVPVSGQRSTELADALSTVPIWAFASHGDPWVSPDNSKQMCDVIQEHGGKARLTEFDGDAHDCWSQAVDESELLQWMLVQRRNPLQTSASSARGGGGLQATGKLRAWNDP